jgi:hypothetical protein
LLATVSGELNIGVVPIYSGMRPPSSGPALAGFDPVLVTEQGQYLPGKREHGVRYNDRMYLFGSEEALQKFSRTPDAYVARIEQALQAIAAK